MEFWRVEKALIDAGFIRSKNVGNEIHFWNPENPNDTRIVYRDRGYWFIK